MSGKNMFLRALNSRSNDQLTNFQESFLDEWWLRNSWLRPAPPKCFGPPLVMPMAHRKQITARKRWGGWVKLFLPTLAKILRGLLHDELQFASGDRSEILTQSHVLVHFRRSAMLSYLWNLWANAQATLRSCIEKWGIFATCPLLRERRSSPSTLKNNFISGKNRSTRPDMHR